jgi:hypothetical protein
MTTRWPADMPVTQIRIARPTDNLDEVVQFYSEGIGLKILGSFQDDGDGYRGYIFGLPGREVHLEFTATRRGARVPRRAAITCWCCTCRIARRFSGWSIACANAGTSRYLRRTPTGRKRA